MQYFHSVIGHPMQYVSGLSMLRILGICVLALNTICPALGAEAPTKMHFLGIAGWDEYVFDAELTKAQNIVASAYQIKSKPVTLSNYASEKITPLTVKKAFGLVTADTSLENDVFFLFLTSHGSKEQGFVFKKASPYMHMNPQGLKSFILAAKMKNVVLVISACFSGQFKGLATDNILVIMAARSDRTSFGCRPQNEWTYFGRAFFQEGLSKSRNLYTAFNIAKSSISRQEKEEKLLPSEPQIAGGKNLIPLLAKK